MNEKIKLEIDVDVDGINEVSKLNDAVKNTSESVKQIGIESDKTSGKMQENNNSTNNLKDSYGKLAIGIGAAVVAIRGVIQGVSESIQLFDVQVRAEKNLEVSLGKTSQALLDQASALQEISIFGDEAIIAGQALAAQMGLEEEEILKLTPAVLDLAAAKGIDLKQAFEQVSETIGTSGNTLARFGIEVEGAAGSNERLDSTVKALSESFGGQTEATVVGAGRLTQMSNVVGDLKEKFGGMIIGLLDTIAPIETQSQALIREKTEMNALVNAITNTVDGSEERLVIINTLQGKYPKFLENMDAETASNEELRDRLREVNIEYTGKIKAAVSAELLALKAKEHAEALGDVVDKQMELGVLQEALKESGYSQEQVEDAEYLSKEIKRLADNARDADDEFSGMGSSNGNLIAALKKMKDIKEATDEYARVVEEESNAISLLSLDIKSNTEVVEKNTTTKRDATEAEEKYAQRLLDNKNIISTIDAKGTEDAMKNLINLTAKKDEESKKQLAIDVGKLDTQKALDIQLAEGTISDAKALSEEKLRIQQEYLDNKIRLYEIEAMSDGVLTDNELANIKKLKESRGVAASTELSQVKATNKQKVQAVYDTLSTIDNIGILFGKKGLKLRKAAFVGQKAMAISNTTIDTYKSATGAFASLSNIPIVGPVLGGIAAASAVTAGLVNIKKIAATKFDDGGGSPPPPSPPPPPSSIGGGSGVGGGSSVSSVPVPNSISLFGNPMEGSEGQGNQALGLRQQTIRAFIVESDVTSTQNRIKNYQNRSEIG